MMNLPMLLALIVIVGPTPATPHDPGAHKPMFGKLNAMIGARISEFDRIPAGRRAELVSLAKSIREARGNDEAIRLVFICTHNSRRSHMSQIWAATAAAHYGVRGIHTYSGGTESTAFNPRAVDAMRRAGFDIAKTTDDINPIYHVRYDEGAQPLTCFSKKYDGAPNPRSGYWAVMVCDSANAACPVVHGAARRFSITYEDPKVADGTSGEADKYDERCRQIGREMLYLFSRV